MSQIYDTMLFTSTDPNELNKLINLAIKDALKDNYLIVTDIKFSSVAELQVAVTAWEGKPYNYSITNYSALLLFTKQTKVLE